MPAKTYCDRCGREVEFRHRITLDMGHGGTYQYFCTLDCLRRNVGARLPEPRKPGLLSRLWRGR